MLEYAKTAIRLKYKTLYDAHQWRESMRIYQIVLDPTLNGSFFLPYDAEEAIYVKLSWDGVNYSRLSYRERDWIERIGHTRFTLTGNVPLYYRNENLAWPYLGPQNITFTTNDQSPFTVFIEGTDLNDQSINESFIMQSSLMPDGITIIPGTVTTKNQFKSVYSLSKDSGTLTIHDSVSGISITASPERANLVFSQFTIFPAPNWNDQNGNPIPYSVEAQVKLKPDALDNDMSVPRISHIWDALVEYTLSSLYTRARQLTKADAREQKAIAHVQAAVNVERNQSESFKQAIPTIYDHGDYLYYGHGLYVTSDHPFG